MAEPIIAQAADVKWCNIGRHFVDVSKFASDASRKDGRQSRCKICTHEYYLARRHKLLKPRDALLHGSFQRDAVSGKDLICTACRIKKPLDQFTPNKRLLSGHRQPCHSCHKQRLKEHARRIKGQLKAEVITAYGGRCACCGESMSQFLTIDHINNDGAEHRKSLGQFPFGKTIYKWLKERGFPKDNFQLLCFNCNCAKGLFGRCPHQQSPS